MAAFTRLRRDILSQLDQLPVAAEYIHRDMFDVGARYGRDTIMVLALFGTRFIPHLFRLKNALDTIANASGLKQMQIADRLLQALSSSVPFRLPKRLRKMRDACEHHLILTAKDAGVEATRALLQEKQEAGELSYLECTAREAKYALLNRFAAAGAAIRLAAVRASKVGGVLSLDLALPRSGTDWLEKLPQEIERQLEAKLYYGHFLCHVFHHDYIVAKGVDSAELKRELLSHQVSRGAKCPAEHNVGRQYLAPPNLRQHYRELDPTNRFNAGIGLDEAGSDYRPLGLSQNH